MSDPTRQTHRHRILQVQLFIQEHLNEDLSLDRLAREAHFSPYHFHRIFRGIVGEGVREYVRRLRLEQAAILLKVTNVSVLNIALEVGYESHESLTRAFRQCFGVTPSAFRAGERSTISLPLINQENESVSQTVTPMEVEIVTIEPMRVAFLRHVGPYTEVGPTFGKFSASAAERGLFKPGVKVLGIGWDDPEVTPPEKIRYDCCVTVDDSFEPEGELGAQVIPGGEHAKVVLRGSYEHLPEVYQWLCGSWLPTSGREPGNAPPFEIYVNSVAEVAPEDLVTEIYLPLK